MPSLEDTLHDEIDEQEGLGDEARAAVDEAKAHIVDLVDDLQDTQTAMAAVALLVEQQLADVSHKAIRQGYNSSLRRAQKLGDEG